MANIDSFFRSLEKEGLISGRITTAGKNYFFPEKTEGSEKSRGKQILLSQKLAKYASVIFILITAGFLTVYLTFEKGSQKKTKGLEELTDVESTELPGKENVETVIRERVLADVKFYETDSEAYSFLYISGKIFLYKIRLPGSDVRLIINEMIDRINEQAKKNQLQARILTPRLMMTDHLVKLQQGGYLEKWQIFMNRNGEAAVVKKTGSNYVSIEKISDWETLSRDKKIFTRIILKKAGE